MEDEKDNPLSLVMFSWTDDTVTAAAVLQGGCRRHHWPVSQSSGRDQVPQLVPE